MTILAESLIIVASVAGMEVFAWAFHKYYMHGPGWNLHESHHIRTEGLFEKNDLYGVWFSLIAMSLFIVGSLWWEPLWYVALGFTIYGLLYAFVHDGLVHQRWPFRYSPQGGYFAKLVLAHKLHHHITTKDGAVSFGFLWAPDPERLKAKLKANTTQN